jgi:arylsulfatase A-like enzyme
VRSRVWISCACLGLALAHGCAREAGPPNLLLITLDTTRRDHCSVYGYERETTPNLERVAAEGVRFALAYAPSSTTAPSHATLFTSLHPITHRVLRNGRVLLPLHETLAERVRERGWVTAGFVSSFVLAERFGYAQGFETWDDDFDPATATTNRKAWQVGDDVVAVDRRGDATTERVLAWLEKDGDESRPFFLFVHYFDPHAPYVPPSELASRFPPADGPSPGLRAQVARYDAEIAFADQQVGRLLAALDRLGLAADTLVAITADHGEGLMQHGLMGHGAQLYEEQVRVPLLLRWPGHLPAGRVIEDAVSLIDLAPTLLELAGVPSADGNMQGRSLASLLAGSASLDPERPIFLYRREFEPGQVEGRRVAGEKYGVRLGDFKLVLGPEEGTRELFDVLHDPREREELAAAEPARAAELEKRIADWLAESKREMTAPDAVSEEDLERLRALGYVK